MTDKWHDSKDTQQSETLDLEHPVNRHKVLHLSVPGFKVLCGFGRSCQTIVLFCYLNQTDRILLRGFDERMCNAINSVQGSISSDL